MCYFFNNFILGIVAGLISSLLIWFLTTILLTPNIKISREIQKIKQSDGKILYKVKIKNYAFFRDAYDISTYFRLLYKRTYITLNAPLIPVLLHKTRNRLEVETERLLPIDFKQIKENRIEGFKDEKLYDKWDSGNLTFDDFFDNDTHFEVVLIAHDKFSGACKRVLVINYNNIELQQAIQEGNFIPGSIKLSTEQTPGEPLE